MNPPDICTIPSCPNKRYTKCHCKKHAERFAKHHPKCSVSNCRGSALSPSGGFCSEHDERYPFMRAW